MCIGFGRTLLICTVLASVDISAGVPQHCRALDEVTLGSSLKTLVQGNNGFDYSHTAEHDGELDALRPDKAGIETMVRARNDRIVEVTVRSSKRYGTIEEKHVTVCGRQRWIRSRPGIADAKEICRKVDDYIEVKIQRVDRGVTQITLLDTRFAPLRVNASEEVIRKRFACART
jgi:hypothetical protein